MADLVKIRASVFIGHLAWLPSMTDPATGNIFEFAADSRGFTPNAVNTGRSRVEQEVTIDFVKKRLVSFAGTGTTVLRVTTADGAVRYESGKAPTDGIVVEREQWKEAEVAFLMKASASNPLRPGAPTVDYLLEVTVMADGTVRMKGSHDGFPCYEIYKQVDFGDFETIYTHNFHETGDTPAAMAGDLEYHFEKIS